MLMRVYVRSLNSNRLITVFDIGDAQQAYNISATLMESAAWSSCYVQCMDAKNTQVFTLKPKNNLELGFVIPNEEEVGEECVPESGIYELIREA